MAKAKANVSESVNCNKNAIIIVVTIVVLAVIFMYFRDRQQKRQLQLERLGTQMDVMEEWVPQNFQSRNIATKCPYCTGGILDAQGRCNVRGCPNYSSMWCPPRQNRQMNNTMGQSGGKVL